MIGRSTAVALGAMGVALAASGGAPGASAPADRLATAHEDVGGTVDLKGVGVVDRSRGRGSEAGTTVAIVAGARAGKRAVVAIGAPHLDTEAGHESGRVRVIELKPDRRARRRAAKTLFGPGKTAQAGTALAVAQLGGAALVVGASNAKAPDGERPGAVYIVPRKKLPHHLDLRHPGRRVTTLRGAEDGDETGAAVAALPDLDGDRRSEIAVGAPGTNVNGLADAGTVYVVFSATLEPGVVQLATDPGVARIDGAERRARLGESVGGAEPGAVIAGAPGGAGGAAYVLPNLTAATHVDTGGPRPEDRVLLGRPGDGAGTSVAGAGDVNSDGIDDVIVGAPDAAGRSGVAYIVYGRAAGGVTQLQPGAATDGFAVIGATARDATGTAVGPAGDVDGDGAADVLVGSPGDAPIDRSGAGSVALVFGGPGDVALRLPGRRALRLAGAAAHDRAGLALAGDAELVRGQGPGVLVSLARAGKATVASHLALPGAVSGAEACRPNYQVIVDDSAQAIEAAGKFDARRAAVDLLAGKPNTLDKTIGAIGAGQVPTQALAPLQLTPQPDPSRASVIDGLMKEALEGSGEGAQDLSAAVEAGEQRTPDAIAVVIAAAGAPPPPDYAPGIPVIVVPLQTPGIADDLPALRELADRSPGGAMLDPVPPDELPARLAKLDADRSCGQQDPVERAGGTDTATVKGDVDSVDLVLTVDAPDRSLSVPALRLIRSGREVMRFGQRAIERALRGGRPRVQGLTLTASQGPMFLAFRITDASTFAVTAKKPRGQWKYRPKGKRKTKAHAFHYPRR